MDSVPRGYGMSKEKLKWSVREAGRRVEPRKESLQCSVAEEPVRGRPQRER